MEHGQIFAQIFVARMLNTAVEGVAIALFAWLLLSLLRRLSSTTRFAVWLFALATIVALPFVGGMTLHQPAFLFVSNSLAFRLPAAWAVELFAVWAMLSAFGLAKIVLSFFRLRTLRSSCQQVDVNSLDSSIQEILTEFATSRPVTILKSPRVRVPAAIGFLRPAILLPEWCLRELAPTELNAILLHELAHLRRWDDWTNLAQQVLRALFFFHPAVWFVGRGLSLEREMACDDFVLARTANSRAYAECLVSIAEKSLLHRGVALAMAAVGHVQQTAQRLRRILSPDRSAATKICKPAVALAAAFSFLCLFVLPSTLPLVEFENALPLSAAASGVASQSHDAATAGARMIPAALHYTAPSLSSGKSAQPYHPLASSLPAHHAIYSRVTKPKAIAAGFVSASELPDQFAPHAAHQPKVLNASAKTSAEDAADPHSVLLIMQTEQLDDFGQVTWSVSIWHLTVFHPAPSPKEIAPKTT